FRPLLERPRAIKPGGLVAQTARSGGARGHAVAGGLSIAASRRILPATLPADVWGGTTVHVAEEPSVASAGRVVLYALNWDTAYSTNGGKTFTEMDPHTTFPPVHYTSGPVQCNPTTPCFCCDQVVMYDPKFDRFIWVLQYNSDSAGENVIRVAYASSSKLATLGPKAWSWFDLPSFDLAGSGNF